MLISGRDDIFGQRRSAVMDRLENHGDGTTRGSDPLKEEKPWARTLYTRKKPKSCWDELVLSADVRSLLEIIFVENKYAKVLGRWGFEGVGAVVLFSGSPGTGKTMAAEAVAAKLKKNLTIVRADKLHSGIVYVTQENIGRLFEEASAARDVLFIDEAEAMLGQRIQRISDWADVQHNGNICVFLQRLEEYEGLVIIATNYPKLLDPALERRITLEVPFDIPNYEERLQLWEIYLPSNAPLSLEADIKEIARIFALTGASIRNAARQAARLALMRSGKSAVISHDDLLKSCKMEITRQARGMANQ